MTDLVWLWVVYRVDSDAVFGAIRRAERLYKTPEEARSAVGQVADRMGAGEIRWVDSCLINASGIRPPLLSLQLWMISSMVISSGQATP